MSKGSIFWILILHVIRLHLLLDQGLSMGVSFTKYLNFRFDERIIVKPEVKRVLSFIQGGIERTKFLILGRRVLVRCSLKRVCRGVGSRTDLEWVPVVC